MIEDIPILTELDLRAFYTAVRTALRKQARAGLPPAIAKDRHFHRLGTPSHGLICLTMRPALLNAVEQGFASDLIKAWIVEADTFQAKLPKKEHA